MLAATALAKAKVKVTEETKTKNPTLLFFVLYSDLMVTLVILTVLRNVGIWRAAWSSGFISRCLILGSSVRDMDVLSYSLFGLSGFRFAGFNRLVATGSGCVVRGVRSARINSALQRA